MNYFEELGITPKEGKLTPEQINKVKGLGCLRDKRYDDVFNVELLHVTANLQRKNTEQLRRRLIYSVHLRLHLLLV